MTYALKTIQTAMVRAENIPDGAIIRIPGTSATWRLVFAPAGELHDVLRYAGCSEEHCDNLNVFDLIDRENKTPNGAAFTKRRLDNNEDLVVIAYYNDTINGEASWACLTVHKYDLIEVQYVKTIPADL